MYYLLLLLIVVPASSVIPTKGKMNDQEILDLISWQEVVQEVNKTNILAQVLQEYLHDIELVEAAAASKCTTQHRDRYTQAQRSLKEDMEFCVKSLQKTIDKEALVKCIEDRARTTISDVRNDITSLKSCLDSS